MDIDPEIIKRHDIVSRHMDLPRRRRWRRREQKPRFLIGARWAGQEPGSSASY
jgi:hypothetical protein